MSLVRALIGFVAFCVIASGVIGLLARKVAPAPKRQLVAAILRLTVGVIILGVVIVDR